MMFTNVRALPHLVAKFIGYLIAKRASLKDAQLSLVQLPLKHNGVKFLRVRK
jgi:hypothetical protein